MKDQLTSESPFRLETALCALCGSDRQKVYISQAKELYIGLDHRFDVVQCICCGFVFTNPRPTRDTVSYFYPDSASYYEPKLDRAEDRLSRKRGIAGKLRRSILANYFGYRFDKLPKWIDFPCYLYLRRKFDLAHLPRCVSGGRLLDIGCAWGGYLARARDLGWETHGVEMNRQAAAYAREKLGLTNVYAGSFDDMSFPADSFDVVHMSMVLEHLYDPAASLKKIHRLLREGGQIILSVPDITGFEARLYKGNFYSLHVPQHVNHFSPRTITRMLNKTGFRVDKIVHQKNRKDLIKSAEYQGNATLLRIFGNSLVRNLFIDPLLAILAGFGKSSRMSIFATRIPAQDCRDLS